LKSAEVRSYLEDEITPNLGIACAKCEDRIYLWSLY